MPTTTISEQGSAGESFSPTFSELLASEDPELLREPLRRWMAKRDRRERCGAVYERWLKAGGEPELIRDSAIELHQVKARAPCASHVLCLAGGDGRNGCR